MFNGKTIIIATLLVALSCSAFAGANTLDLPGIPLHKVTEPLAKLQKEQKTPVVIKTAANQAPADVKKTQYQKKPIKLDLNRRKKEEPSSVLLSMTPGENLVIPVAINHPNRILTPFDNAKVFTTRADEVKTEGGVVYVVPAKTGPLTMFITERDGDQTISLSLTLMPSPIPPREVKLLFNGIAGQHSNIINGNKKQARKFERKNSHFERINSVMIALAKQEIPTGYSLRRPDQNDPSIICDLPGTVIKTGQVLEGYSLTAMVSVISNTTNQPIQIRESSCWQQGVLGVSMWPPVEFLQPGGSAELYVLFDKTQEVETNKKVRPALLTSTRSEAN